MRRKRKILILMACILWGLTLSPPRARATLITIQIEAVVDYVGDPHGYLEGKVSPGDIITGSYMYESTTPDTNPLERGGRYEHAAAPHGIFLSVGGFDFETNPGNVDFLIEVENDHPPDDNYFLRSRNNLPLSNAAPVDRISWHLHDPTGRALSSDALPTTAPVLDAWQWNILGFGADRLYGVTGHVSSAIPEPATLLLLGMGGLFLRKRGRSGISRKPF